MIKAIAIITMIYSQGLLAHPLDNLNKLGEGEMQVMFWSIYQAEFFISHTDYQTQQWPQALKLTYHRDITRQALVDATEDQWQHLNFEHPSTQRWLQQLLTIWPDIKQDEQIILYVDDQGMSHFYANDQQRGVIEDPDFANAFLAIWLSPKTSEPPLRKKLLRMAK